MLKLLLEGFSSAWLPCSLILLVPGTAALLAARRHLLPAIAGFTMSAVLLSWYRFSDRGGDWPVAFAAIALAVATVLFLVPLITSAEDVTATMGGLLVGGAAAELWEPCVGPEFGQLLNGLPSNGISGLAQLLLFMIGVLSPLIGVLALLKLAPEWIMDSIDSWLAVIGGTVLAVIAVATAVGLHDDVVGKLFQWSL